MHKTESLCYILETNTTLYINYISFKKFYKKIKGGKVKGGEFAFVIRGWGEMGRKTPPV